MLNPLDGGRRNGRDRLNGMFEGLFVLGFAMVSMAACAPDQVNKPLVASESLNGSERCAMGVLVISNMHRADEVVHRINDTEERIILNNPDNPEQRGLAVSAEKIGDDTIRAEVWVDTKGNDPAYCENPNQRDQNANIN